MKWKYKTVMFLTLLIFCVGSVCATDTSNTISDNYTIADYYNFYSDTDLNEQKFNKSYLNETYKVGASDEYEDCINYYKSYSGDNLKDSVNLNSYYYNNTTYKLINGSFVNTELQELIKEKFKDKSYFNVSSEQNNNYNSVNSKMNRLNKLSIEIVNSLNNIDSEINKTLKQSSKTLLVIKEKFKSNDVKNYSIALNNALNANYKCLKTSIGYSNTMKHYLDLIKEYYKIKQSIDVNNVSVNDTLQIIEDITNNIKSKIEILNTIINNAEQLNNCLNRVKYILEH